MQDAAQGQLLPALPESPSVVNWEWFWRFLALVLFISTSWVIWVLIEMNPNPLATPAAFAAASHATQGTYAPAPGAQMARSGPGASPELSGASHASVSPGATEAGISADSLPVDRVPPVDLQRLKRSDTLSLVPLEKMPSVRKDN